MEQLNMLAMEIGDFLSTKMYHLIPFGLKAATLDTNPV